jgi:hypothetical protein
MSVFSFLGASIPLQQLVNHTASRILQIVDMGSHTIQKATLVFKYGCDGCSGHPEYYQSPLPNSEVEQEDSDDDDSNQLPPSDSYLFLFTAVPLQLIGETENGAEIVLWKNSRPSSTKYCRPMKFLYLKETLKDIQVEVQKVQSEISNLTPFTCEELRIDFQMLMSMVDGKVINALTSSSSQVCTCPRNRQNYLLFFQSCKSLQSCYICGAKPSQMNDENALATLTVKEERLNYGLSVLHASIKFMELILTLAYLKGYEKRTKRGATDDEKKEIEERTKEVRQKLYKALGIKVSIMKIDLLVLDMREMRSQLK